MLTDIKRIRLYKREIKVTTYGRIYEDYLILDTSSYISAIFHAQLYDEGDFQLVLSYDEIAKKGVLNPIIGNAATIIVELCGESTGTLPEMRVFKTTKVSIVNDDNNNKTVVLTGVGALGFYKNIPFGRISSTMSEVTATTLTDGTVYAPTKLVIKGYYYNNDYLGVPLEHLYRQLIYPFGVVSGTRQTITGLGLCCSDLGLWIVQDRSRGYGDVMTPEEQDIAMQDDVSEWISNFMKSYNMGIVGCEYAITNSSTPVDGYTPASAIVPKMTIAKFRNTGLIFSDTDGSFKLNNIDFNRDYIGEAPLVRGQSLQEVGVDESVKTFDGIKLFGCYPKVNLKNFGFSIGGNIVIDGTTGYAGCDINKPPILESSYAIDDVTTETYRQEACDALTAISQQQSSLYSNSITINGVINVASKPDIYLGDSVVIKALDGAIIKNVVITGITYVSEGDGFKIEIDYE